MDPSSGGTIRGVSFASDGTLELARNFEGVDLQLPLTFDSVTDMSNIENWQLKVDGKQKNEYKVSVRNNSVFIRKPGFMVIVF